MNVMEARRRTLGGGVYEKTVSGETVLANGSLARRYPGLHLYGQSTQESTTGAQLFDISKVISSLPGLENNGDSLHVTTISGDAAAYGLPPNTLHDYAPSLKAGQTYYLTANSTGETKLIYLGGTVWNFNSSMVVTENMLQSAVYFYASGEETEADISEIMICEGTTAKPFEPYTGGAPSPSPDYPQEIVSKAEDGQVEVEVLGGNLWDGNFKSGYFGIDGIVRSYADEPTTFYLIVVPCAENTEYTLSYKNNMDRCIIGYSTENVEEGTKIQDVFDASGQPNTTINTGNNAKYLCAYVYNKNVDVGKEIPDMIMINQGNTALPYEPYKTPQTLTVSTQNGLPGIPVTSGGNYTDETGQQWVCDEVDFKRGVYVQRVKKASNITWALTSGYAVEGSELFMAGSITDGKAEGNPYINTAFCSKLQNNYLIGNQNISGFYQNASTIYARIKDVSDVEEFNQLMSGAEILYQLQMTIETPLSAEELAAYAGLHTNYPTTTVINDEGVYMSLDYKTKKSLEVN